MMEFQPPDQPYAPPPAAGEEVYTGWGEPPAQTSTPPDPPRSVQAPSELPDQPQSVRPPPEPVQRQSSEAFAASEPPARPLARPSVQRSPISVPAPSPAAGPQTTAGQSATFAQAYQERPPRPGGPSAPAQFYDPRLSAPRFANSQGQVVGGPVYAPSPYGGWNPNFRPPPGNGVAVAALITSIGSPLFLVMTLGFAGPLSIVASIAAMVLGVIGARAVKMGKTTRHKGMAWTGFWLGVIGLAAAAAATIWWIYVFFIWAGPDEISGGDLASILGPII